MPTFSSRKLGPSLLTDSVRNRPVLLFGLPFVGIIVLGSFALSSFTQTRYDLRDRKITSVTKEEELHMKKGRKKLDIREEYFRLQSAGEEHFSDDWENKRVERLPGQADWGELPISKKK